MVKKSSNRLNTNLHIFRSPTLRRVAHVKKYVFVLAIGLARFN